MKKSKFVFRMENYAFRAIMFLIQSILYNFKAFQPQTVKKILIIRLKHLGDMVITLPILKILKDNFPQSSITIVVGSWNVAMVKEFAPFIDPIYVYNSPQYARTIDFTATQTKQLWRKLKEENFDLTIDLDGSWKFLPFYLLKNTRYLASIAYCQTIQNLKKIGLTNSKAEYDIHHQYEGKNLLAPLKKVIKETGSIQYIPHLNKQAYEWWADFSRQNKLMPGKKIITIHPGTSRISQMYSSHWWSKIGTQLREHFDAHIMFVGGKSEKKVVSEVGILQKTNAIYLIDLEMLHFFSLIAHSQLIICMDSFCQHVGGLFSIPRTVFYIDGNPVRWTNPDQLEKGLVVNVTQKIEPDNILQYVPPIMKNGIRP